MNINRRAVLGAVSLSLMGCSSKQSQSTMKDGTVEKSSKKPSIYVSMDDRFSALIDSNAEFEVLGEGYGWSEGPTWDRKRDQLYFTDVPGNTAYVWRDGGGVSEFLNPSGSDATTGFREPGANGLLYDRNGDLLVCNHGSRSVERINLETKVRETLASRYQGKRFNSPNDVIESRSGDIYFTDPPYGLEGLNQSPLKELSHNGVYRLTPDGALSLLADQLSFPNGAALSPDETTLYVTQSDPNAAHIYTLDLTEEQPSSKLWVDLTPYLDADNPGLPDGMAVDEKGNIFSTGPGGIFIISPEGDILGRIKTGKGSANCTFGEDGRTLFITNHDRLIKVRTQTRGLAWT